MIWDALKNLWQDSGFANMTWQQLMIIIACVLLFLAIVKEYEPLLLVTIALECCLPTYPKRDLWQSRGDENGGLLYYLYLGVEKEFILL